MLFKKKVISVVRSEESSESSATATKPERLGEKDEATCKKTLPKYRIVNGRVEKIDYSNISQSGE